MSSNQLLLELIGLSSGIDSFSQLQLLNVAQSNSLFAFSPQLLDFVSSCGSSLNELEQLTASPVNSLLLNLNAESGESACLEQLIQLEQLFLSGNNNIDLNNNGENNNNNLSNSTESSNSTASVSSSSANLNSSSSAANSSASADAQKGKGKSGKKEGRSEIVQRSAGEKRRVIGSLGFVAFMLLGTFAL